MGKVIKTVLTTVCTVLLCAVIILSCVAIASAESVEERQVQISFAGQTEASQSGTEAVTEEPAEKAEFSVEDRLLGMVNRNYCYGEAFKNVSMMASSAAVSLEDYSVEIEGVGFCVNASLVAGFIKSFYGVSVKADDIKVEGVPDGYVLIPNTEKGTMVHTPVSITEKGDTIVLVTCVEIYFGGDDMETFLAKSVFKVDESSPYGYNLISSELL